MFPSKLAFVDVETTGLDASTGRIIEIGILRVKDNKIVSTFSSLVNPQEKIDVFSSQLTGITQKELDNAPTFYELQEEVYKLLENCVFVAHNVQFDYGFVRNEFKKVAKRFTAKRLCTVQLFRYLYPNSYAHNLDVLIERFGFECERRHRAFDDAKVLWEFYRRVQRVLPREDVENAIEKLLEKPTRASSLKKHSDLLQARKIT